MYMEGYSYGTVSWSIDGRPVFRAKVSQPPAEKSWNAGAEIGWKVATVQRIEAGPWIVDALELDHRIEKERLARMEGYSTKVTLDNAKELPSVDELERLLRDARSE